MSISIGSSFGTIAPETVRRAAPAPAPEPTPSEETRPAPQVSGEPVRGSAPLGGLSSDARKAVVNAQEAASDRPTTPPKAAVQAYKAVAGAGS